MKTIGNRRPETGNARGFTLIELLVVISIMAVLAAFTIPVLKSVKRQQQLKVARAELEQLSVALENYKAKYGAYPPGNQNPANLASTPPYYPEMFNQLFYELSGTELKGSDFVTLDGVASIQTSPANDVKAAFGVDGFINCTKGSGEDGVQAQDFLTGFKANQYNTYVTNSGVRTTVLVTKDGGPDQNYQPLGAPGINPIRYRYPGVNNPNSYDLWVQLVINGKTNLICNWNKETIINSPLP